MLQWLDWLLKGLNVVSKTLGVSLLAFISRNMISRSKKTSIVYRCNRSKMSNSSESLLYRFFTANPKIRKFPFTGEDPAAILALPSVLRGPIDLISFIIHIFAKTRYQFYTHILRAFFHSIYYIESIYILPNLRWKIAPHFRLQTFCVILC